MTQKPYGHGEFCWYEIGTRDVPRAKAFYAAMFGWGFKDVPMPGQSCMYTLLQLEGRDVAGLYEMKGDMFEGVPPHWMVYMASDDVDATTALTQKLGGTVPMGPMDVPGVGRMAVCQDPTGAIFSVMKCTEHTGTACFAPRHGIVSWRELLTKNPDQAGHFYTTLFHWGTKVNPNVSGGAYTEFKVGDVSIGGMMPLPAEWGEVPSHWGIYIQVDDANAAEAKARSLGAKTIVPPTDIPRVGRFSLLQDPTGAGFSIIQLTS